ncbi:MAG: alpha-L-fucosidase [Puniceicoccales bacterium]|jgi:alpha-L-fucosidase|nr:alpha-L-fucosidase [Puniceicoccales bacterium]
MKKPVPATLTAAYAAALCVAFADTSVSNAAAATATAAATAAPRQTLALPPFKAMPPTPPVAKHTPLGDLASFPEVKMDFPIADGPFGPSWESIHANYRDYPAWLREAKFGFWVHFGPQASGMSGDWYARRMYAQGQRAYANHIRDFGHPSEAGKGYKDILRTWNPPKYDPAALVKRYRKAGARFLFVQGVHHDNYDLWDSTYQPWNSVKVGPKRDLLAEWAHAVRAENMRYGITFHHEYTWWWWETAFRSDKTGAKKGRQYDGSLVYTNPLGKGEWWEGLDLRMLYGISLREYGEIARRQYTYKEGIFSQHLPYAHWYATNWALRILDAVNKYDPDFIYTDGNDTQPFSGRRSGSGYKSDAAQRVIASYYNQTLKNRGAADVFSIVKFHPAGRRGVVTTFEGTYPDGIKTDQAWIGENPVGDWYYGPGFVYTADGIIRFLLECVSRDGCYAVSIPIRPDGSLDPQCERMLDEIGAWFEVNGAGIYGSKAWKTFGEGKDGKIRLLPKGNIGRKQDEFRFHETDFRFTQGKDGAVYAYCMTVPASGAKLLLASFGEKGKAAGLWSKPPVSVELLGHTGKLEWALTPNGLEILCPEGVQKMKTAICFRVR